MDLTRPPTVAEADVFLVAFASATRTISLVASRAAEATPQQPPPNAHFPPLPVAGKPRGAAAQPSWPRPPSASGGSGGAWLTSPAASVAPLEKDVPDSATVRTAAMFHVGCVRAFPRRLVSTLRVLAVLLRSAQAVPEDWPLSWQPPEPVQHILRSWPVLEEYAAIALKGLSTEILALPQPVCSAFAACTPSALPRHETAEFPIVHNVPPWHPPVLEHLPSVQALQEAEQLTQKLSRNLEVAWDQVLQLQRQYLGEVNACAPGTLDLMAALLATAAVHPANMDAFAQRFLRLVSRSALQARDASPRMRQLGARLRSAGQVGNSALENRVETHAAEIGPGRRQGRGGGRRPQSKGMAKVVSGVVLHRVPAVVRAMFEGDPTELFFLDFLTGVDSAKLYSALIPRLTAALLGSLAAAAASTSNNAFTDAVLDARLYAKFLSVAMNASNWAHSPQSFSGKDEAEAMTSPGLGSNALIWRSPIHSASWSAVFDVAGLVHSAMQSGQLLAIVATVAVADVVVRLSSVDPIAKASDWYKRGLQALHTVRVRASSTESRAPIEASALSMPLLNVLIGDLFESSFCADAVSELPSENFSTTVAFTNDQNTWSSIGDVRLISSCLPPLEELRQLLLSPTGPSIAPKLIKAPARRITPLATASPEAVSSLRKSASPSWRRPRNGTVPGVSNMSNAGSPGSIDRDRADDVQAALRREFYTKMDGRLRELIGVVVSSKPCDDATAIETYTDVAKTLYPSTPQTVVAVAARLCARDADAQRRGDESDEGMRASQQNTSVRTRRGKGPVGDATEKLAGLQINAPD